jgi:acyl-CoA synthetase (AMP-forming)/AMP-acid ligase II
MTEAAHQMASNPLPPGARKAGSVGPAAGPEVAVMHEEENRLLAQGETGEVVIRGPNVTLGYANNPEANAVAFSADGWFRTGDQGYMDSDRYLHLTGRLKEIINRGGEKISPREVDEILLDHPDVSQAVTFAVPHATLGEAVAAAVILGKGSDTNEAALRRFAAARLADAKVPDRIVVLDKIPKGPTGKLQRIGLAGKLGLTAEQPTSEPARFEKPQGKLEAYLSELWVEILKLEKVGRHDRFLTIGGDSMTATRLVARLRHELEIDLTLVDFFEAPTIAEQAAIIAGKIT